MTSVSDNNHEGFQPRMSELQLPFAGRSNPTRKKFVIIQIRTNGNVISRKVTLKNSGILTYNIMFSLDNGIRFTFQMSKYQHQT